MVKEESKHGSHGENSFGTASVILGIFSILFSSPPLYGVILGILSLMFANKQNKYHKNSWSKAGKILSIIGIVLSILFFVFILWLQKNPDIYSKLIGGGLQQNA